MYILRLAIFIGFMLHLGAAKADWSAGPLYDEFSLTLAPGKRTEALGPLFFLEQKESQKQFALPPLFSCTRDAELESEELDFLYPLLTYDRYGAEYRFQILQLFSFAGGNTQDEEKKGRFTLFPIYFHQRSSVPELNYTALFPIYGTLKNRLFRDEIFFIGFPLYAKSRKKDVVTDNYLFPVFHLRRGNALRGWQVWPIVGAEHKDVTTRTNSLDEEEIIGGHDKFFAPWPIFFKNTTGIGTDNPEKQISVLPLFTRLRSPRRDSLTAPWPIGLTITDDREKKYHEIGAPWPLIVFARGEGKNTSRVWPIFSRASNTNLQSNFYLWPIYKYNRLYSPPLERERTRILFFLYSDISEKNLETDSALHRVDFWPLFTFRRDLEGKQRLQILALLEPILPNNKSIERDYSPIWSIWRAEKNPQTHASSQSLLWNLYRRDVSATTKKCSLLFGLFQYESVSEGKRWRLCYFPFGTAKNPVRNEPKK
ncbi:MAG: hypothetical protein ABIR24_13590 [Verrucomicrobiota bacterium]